MESAVLERPQSDLTHTGASAVFELAEKQPVLIKRRHNADQVLLSAETYDALLRFARNLYLVTRALTKGPERMVEIEGLHWSKLFDADERRTMLLELVEAARASSERKDPALFNATWKGWEHSAELMNDPEALRALTAPVDPDATVALARPIG